MSYFKVKTLAVDFRRLDIYQSIEETLNSLQFIDVLVNNVGTVNDNCEYFTLIESNTHESIINVNIISYTKMIEMVLPKMVSQKRGIIINVGSLAGLVPTPLYAVYSSSEFSFYKFSNHLNDC